MKKLSTKLLVYILLPVVAITVVTGVVSFFSARHILVEEMKGHFTIGLRQAKDQFEAGAWRGVHSFLVLAAIERTAGITEQELGPVLAEVRKKLPVHVMFVGFPDGRLPVVPQSARVAESYDPGDQVQGNQRGSPISRRGRP